MASKEKYERYHEALDAGISKIATYYNKTSSIDAYNITMSAFFSYFPLNESSMCECHVVLDPSIKTHHYQKHWADKKELDVRTKAETVVRRLPSFNHAFSHIVLVQGAFCRA